jgi:hypothetical protein
LPSSSIQRVVKRKSDEFPKRLREQKKTINNKKIYLNFNFYDPKLQVFGFGSSRKRLIGLLVINFLSQLFAEWDKHGKRFSFSL